MDEEGIMNAATKKRKASMNRYVSHDIIEEILSYLPYKSLLRFKVVSKQWNSLLHNSRFIDKRRRRNMNQPSHFLYFDQYSDDTKITLHMYEIDVDGYFRAKTIKTAISKSYEVLMQSSYGLICLHYYFNRKLVVFNPSTEHIINLPDYPEPFQSFGVFLLGDDFERDNYHVYFNNLGFGFDVKSKRYKAVQLVRVSENNGISKCHVLTVERFESHWREINDASLDSKFKHLLFPVCVDGVIYWQTELMAPDERICILMFDLSCEKIKMIFAPEECKDVRSHLWRPHMVELQGNLCFVDVPRTFEKFAHMNIWRLDYSNDGNIGWAPMYKLELGLRYRFHDYVVPLCINDRRIIVRDERAMYCYDVEKKCLKTYKGDGKDLVFFLRDVHTETIVSLD